MDLQASWSSRALEHITPQSSALCGVVPVLALFLLQRCFTFGDLLCSKEEQCGVEAKQSSSLLRLLPYWPLYVSSGRASEALLTEPGHMQFFLLHSVHKFVPSGNTVGPLQVSFLARRQKISSSKSANSCSRSDSSLPTTKAVMELPLPPDAILPHHKPFSPFQLTWEQCYGMRHGPMRSVQIKLTMTEQERKCDVQGQGNGAVYQEQMTF